MEWKHTKKRPTASTKGSKWRLRVQYFRRLTDKTTMKRKSTEDSAFRGNFGDKGLYSSKEAADSDADRFRTAVDGETKREGRGGWRPREEKKEVGEKAGKAAEERKEEEKAKASNFYPY